jgi:predicted nucleic-acid-binding protein
MSTTIQIEKGTRDVLNQLKLHNRETYNDVIHRMIEDSQELNLKTKREIKKAIAEIESGKYKTLDELISDLGF